MAATNYALQEQVSGSTWAAAYGNSVQTLDILQIVDAGGSTLLNIDSTGTVHKPSSSPTNGTHAGVFESSITSGSTAAIVAATFTNPANLDILQLVAPAGGGVTSYIDYLGVSH